MKSQLLIMLEMQDAMNSRVNPDWRQAGNAWYRAIWTECAEMLDHYGWKWWKHQEPDFDQVHLELVDIMHFAMSDYLLQDSDNARVAERIAGELSDPGQETDIRAAIEATAQSTIANQSMHFSAFANIMALAEMDFDKLFRMYVGKNVLNFFRQDHGYKEGSYVKIWDGREDNEHLAELLVELDSARVLTHPVEGREADYNQWYTEIHLAEVLALPGFVAVQRFKLSEAQMMDTGNWQYLDKRLCCTHACTAYPPFQDPCKCRWANSGLGRLRSLRRCQG